MARRTIREEAEEIESDRLEGFPHPRKTPDIVGHQEAMAEVAGAIASGRMHHAWLLCGPRGIGKATLAYRMARTLLKYGVGVCVPTNLSIAGEDQVFHWVQALSHPDFLLLRRQVDDKGNIQNVLSVAVARRATDFFAHSAGEGGWRVCIVDSVDDMNLSAANALLKILEEPPAKSVFLLISHSPGRLLPTIRSRCRKLILSPLSESDLTSVVLQHFPEMNRDDLLLSAKLAQGSPGHALAMIRDGGLDQFRELIRLLMALPTLDMAALHTLGDRLSRANAETSYDAMTQMLSAWLARMIRAGAAGVLPDDRVAGEAALIERLVAAAPLDQWTQVWENINSLLRRADSVNLNRKQVILSIFSRLAETARRR